MKNKDNEDAMISIICKIPFSDWKKVKARNIDEMQVEFKGMTIIIPDFVSKDENNWFEINKVLFSNNEFQEYVNSFKKYLQKENEKIEDAEKKIYNQNKLNIINKIIS